MSRGFADRTEAGRLLARRAGRAEAGRSGGAGAAARRRSGGRRSGSGAARTARLAARAQDRRAWPTRARRRRGGGRPAAANRDRARDLAHDRREPAYVEREAKEELREIARRRTAYLSDRPPWRWKAARPCWSTTASRPAPRCARRCRRCVAAGRPGWCWRFRWHRRKSSRHCAPRSTISCASRTTALPCGGGALRRFPPGCGRGSDPHPGAGVIAPCRGAGALKKAVRSLRSRLAPAQGAFCSTT